MNVFQHSLDELIAFQYPPLICLVFRKLIEIKNITFRNLMNYFKHNIRRILYALICLFKDYKLLGVFLVIFHFREQSKVSQSFWVFLSLRFNKIITIFNVIFLCLNGMGFTPTKTGNPSLKLIKCIFIHLLEYKCGCI